MKKNILLIKALFLAMLTFSIANSNAQNYFAGVGAGNGGVTGILNTGVGTNSLHNLTKGHYNVATGSFALYYDTTGSSNTANGYASLYYNTTGSYNTANGYASLIYNNVGSENTANGFSSLYHNTTGSYNTAGGYYSLNANLIGSYNTATGYKALQNNTTDYNTATGSFALQSNTTGLLNTAIGFNSMISNLTGNYNTGLGSSALGGNETGNYNTGVGSYVLGGNETGNYNTGAGSYALNNNVTGQRNTAVGYAANVTTGDLFNATAIGYSARVDASNKVRIGNTAVTSIGGQVGWTTFSDGRYKKDIQENVAGLAFINNLRPVSYTVNVAGLNEYFNKGKKQTEVKDEKGNIVKPAEDNKEAAAEASRIVYNGFVAQEVEEAAKKLNFPFSGVDKPQDKNGLYGLRYDNFIAPLVKAVQELSRQNQDLQKQIDELKGMITNTPSKVAITTSGNVPHVDASLEQNVPNPSSNTTTIAYSLPQRLTNAQILVTDNSGKILKQVNVSGSGRGTVNVDVATFATGTYNYSLIVEGRTVSTKQMILTR